MRTLKEYRVTDDYLDAIEAEMGKRFEAEMDACLATRTHSEAGDVYLDIIMVIRELRRLRSVMTAISAFWATYEEQPNGKL